MDGHGSKENKENGVTTCNGPGLTGQSWEVSPFSQDVSVLLIVTTVCITQLPQWVPLGVD